MDQLTTSATQLELHGRCPYAYQLCYLDGKRPPPSVPQLVGIAAHHAAAIALDSHLRVNPEEAAAEVVVAAAKACWLTEEEEGLGRQKVIAEALRRAMAFAGWFAACAASRYKPVAIERRFRARIAPGISLVGVIDLIADGWVMDWKFGARNRSQRDADTSLQLTCYYVAARYLMRREPAGLRLHSFADSAVSGVKDKIRDTARGPEDLRILEARIQALIAAREKGVFPPCSPRAWYCSSRHCWYARVGACKYFRANGRG